MILLLRDPQKFNSSLIIPLTSCHPIGILSSLNITRNVSPAESDILGDTVRGRVTEHSHITSITVYYCNFSILLLVIVVNLL